MSKLKKWYYILLPIILGSITGLIISKSIDYTNLIKPPLSPPKILFPIMWSIIYILLGISYYLFKKETIQNNFTSKIYYTNLIVNLLWSIIFFLLKLRFLSILWIILLDILTLYLIYLFYKKKKLSAYLNIIYISWTLFATYLTIGIYLLNY